MRLRSLCLSALCITWFAGPAAAQEGRVIRIGTEGAFKPWNFTEASGELVGFELDLAKDLCARMKAKCEIVAQDWDGMIPALNARKFDAIMAGMSITDERRKAIDFSRPYAATYFSFIVPEGKLAKAMPGNGQRISLDGPSDSREGLLAQLRTALARQRLGVQAATVDAVFLERHLGGAVDTVTYRTVEQRDLDLTTGRLDAGFGDMTVLASKLEVLDFAQFRIAGPLITGGVLGQGAGVGLRKGDGELASLFNAAIEQAKADGTIRALSLKWFKFDTTPQ